MNVHPEPVVVVLVDDILLLSADIYKRLLVQLMQVVIINKLQVEVAGVEFGVIAFVVIVIYTQFVYDVVHGGLLGHIAVFDLWLPALPSTLQHIPLLVHDFVQYFVIVVINLLLLLFLINYTQINWYRNLVICQRDLDLSPWPLLSLYWSYCLRHYLIIVAI